METIYTLEDIRDFIKREFPFDWNYDVWDKKTGQHRKATLEDFDYSGIHSTTDLAFFKGKGEDAYSLEVHLSDFAFLTYRDEPNVMGSGSTTYLNRDLTKEWINLLLSTHGEKYAKRLLRYAKSNEQRIKEEAEQKVEKYRLKVQAEAKGPYTYYRDLEQKAKELLSHDDITEI